jgi:hypothetical protein
MQRNDAFNDDEHTAAFAVAALASSKSSSSKRGRNDDEDDDDEDVVMKDCKMAKTMDDDSRSVLKPVQKAPVLRVLRPAPFFYYKDFSQEPDSDPLTPLTALGRVPSFPGK